MSQLPPIPKPPKGVEYTLTSSCSVLFRNLLLRGLLLSKFRKVYGINYTQAYYLADNGSVYWDFSDDDQFNRLLSPQLKPDEVAQKFITVTARTARQLVRTAQIVSSPTRWHSSRLRQDLLEDLNAFWDAYEDHMTCLPTFWNVEKLLISSFVEELTNAGFKEEVNAGLPTFIVPSEHNWFVHEQQNLAILRSRFAESFEDKATLDAASCHANTFGFLSVYANVGTLPSGMDVVTQMKQLVAPAPVNRDEKLLNNLPEKIARLGELVREFIFWRTERLDALTLADQYAAPMYKTLAELLELPLDLMFCMTRDELTRAITCERDVSIETLKQRSEKYCMALIDGVISFYQPTENNTQKELKKAKSGDVFQGLATSPGVVRGRVRIVSSKERNVVLAPDEIIVTEMTRPELGAALDTALAYVTDEGGRLCHAAIVSREKGKPCITGTRKATAELRNGMLIEVDGSAGTVTVVDAD